MNALLLIVSAVAACCAVVAILGWLRAERLGREMDRLARLAAQQSADLDRLRHADEALMQRFPEPLLILDGERTVLRANAASAAAFGPELRAVLRHPGLRGAIDGAFASGTPQRADLSLPAPVPRDLQATVAPLNLPQAKAGQVLVLLSDRTRERVVERMRADFVANASHELRTPLASLIGFIETLRGPAADDPPAQRRFLDIMAEQAARMNRLIDDLLSLSRVELTEHQPPQTRVDLAALLSRLVAGFEPRLSAAAVKLDLRLAPGTPPVIGDADQLTQVAQNLLDNAVKYGRDGGVIRLELVAAEPGGRWPARPGLVLAVADRGPGIPRQHLPRLTERFYRVDKGRSRSVGGTGLGLAIVKHILNRHRGQLAIDSEEGVGTTISVWLPQAPVIEKAI